MQQTVKQTVNVIDTDVLVLVSPCGDEVHIPGAAAIELYIAVMREAGVTGSDNLRELQTFLADRVDRAGLVSELVLHAGIDLRRSGVVISSGTDTPWYKRPLMSTGD